MTKPSPEAATQPARRPACEEAVPRCSGAWGAALGEAREWCPLLPCLEDPLPASSRKPSRVARACPTTCSHQLHNCWALESSCLGRGRGSRNVCSHSNREGGMMPPDLNLAQPIGHGLVTQARPLPAAAAWEQGEAQGRGAGGGRPRSVSVLSAWPRPLRAVSRLSARPTAPSPSVGV